ncbi:MAG: BolA family protein [Mariprofundaceae bacterium]
MNGRTGQIHEALQDTLQPTTLNIEDESWKHVGHAAAIESGGGHFSVHIVANCFKGKSRIQRHRMVHDALKDQFAHAIHALSIHAASPDE